MYSSVSLALIGLCTSVSLAVAGLCSSAPLNFADLCSSARLDVYWSVLLCCCSTGTELVKAKTNALGDGKVTFGYLASTAKCLSFADHARIRVHVQRRMAIHG